MILPAHMTSTKGIESQIQVRIRGGCYVSNTNLDAIAELALQNFIEMRDLVADKDYIFSKKVWHSKSAQC